MIACFFVFFLTGLLLCRIDFCSIICLTGHHSGKQKNSICNQFFVERSGSMVQCLTRDRRATALWSLSKTHLS